MSKIATQKVYTNGSETLVSELPFNTLAQPCQNPTAQLTIEKRARSKFFSLPLAYNLAAYAAWVNSPIMEQAYRNTIYCSSVITQGEGKLTTKYCGNRWCLVCNRVRTARAIEAYKPVLEGWKDRHMVTLTVRNVVAADLPMTLETMRKGFASCLRAIRRTHGFAVTALRKLECTYNFRTDEFHPHYHAIVSGKEQAELLRYLWLHRFPDRTDIDGQDVKQCGEGSLQELFKYFTKLTTKTKDKHRRVTPIPALHTIFHAMRGRRVWQPCGFRLPKEVDEAIEGEVIEVAGAEAFKRPEDQIYWQWDQEFTDWIDAQTGETLSDYAPGEHFKAFVESITDTSSIHQGDAVMAS